jgi:uncharacterized membrane protein SpoIIM required for sporulation
MNELLIAIIFIVSLFIVIPFIVYCIMVFCDKYDNIYYMKNYINELQKHEMKEYFTTPLLNCVVSIYVIFCFILLGITKIISIIWNKIPKISVFENKCTNIWRRFSNWFMNIKIK